MAIACDVGFFIPLICQHNLVLSSYPGLSGQIPIYLPQICTNFYISSSLESMSTVLSVEAKTPESPYSPLPKREREGVTIVSKMKKAMAEKRTFYSFEFFPPKTPAGVENLYTRIDRLSVLEPSFMDVTWGAGGTTADLTLEISASVQAASNCEVMMHLTCTNMPVSEVKLALNKARAAGIRNILALRGDPPKGAETWEKHEDGLSYAVDLVKLIRAEHGDYFGIAVAGYPEGHTQAESIDMDIKYLKDKVDAGADFVVTQLFYDVDIYLAWVKKCRDAGINCPIIPGIMPIQNYAGFQRMTSFCKTFVPPEILNHLATIETDDSAVKAYGIELATKMCRRLLEEGVPGLHFYTLNLERSSIAILENLGFVTPRKAGSLPWKQSQIIRRKNEDVRPIFWANRPRSYLDRTSNWDEFPNGRWGNSASPAFGDLSDYHLCSHRAGKAEDRRAAWGVAPQAPIDIFNIFEQYVEGAIDRLPWCEEKMQLESQPIKDKLKALNKHGVLTINSQPRVNGVSSSDAAVGWGGAGGYVYQKAYLEFFCSPHILEKFAAAASQFPSLSFTGLNAKGDRVTSLGATEDSVTAVTWGVFPDREILQPTVVDIKTFAIWKDEAFALWKSQWQSIYEKDSKSWNLLQEIHDSFYLVTVVDNDFINGDIFAIFDKIMA